MADDVDIASSLAEMHLEHSLAQHAARARDSESLSYCIECDDVIPQKRRAAIKGVKTCVDCQTAIEMRLKTTRGHYYGAGTKTNTKKVGVK